MIVVWRRAVDGVVEAVAAAERESTIAMTAITVSKRAWLAVFTSRTYHNRAAGFDMVFLAQELRSSTRRRRGTRRTEDENGAGSRSWSQTACGQRPAGAGPPDSHPVPPELSERVPPVLAASLGPC